MKKNHFIVVYKVSHKKDRIYVVDPKKGLSTYNTKEFVKKWISSNETKQKGIVLILEPMADFMQRERGGKLERKKTFENLFGYFRPYKKSFMILFIVMFVVTPLQATLPFISKAVIDVGIQTRDVNFINIVLIANIAIIVSMTLGNTIRDWLLMHLTARINVALITDYLIKLMKLPVSFFETKMLGDILQRARDHERIRAFIKKSFKLLMFSFF